MGNRLINFGIRAGGVSYVWDDWSAYSSVSSGTTVTVGDPVEGAQEIQVQTRTRTGYTYSQLQTRTRSCSCSSLTGLFQNDIYGSESIISGTCTRREFRSCSNYSQVVWDDGCYYGSCVDENPQVVCSSKSSFIDCTPNWSYSYTVCYEYESGWFYSPSCSTYSRSCTSTYQLIRTECSNRTETTCNWSGYTGWSNTSSCSATSPSCTQGAVQRQCQTVTLCAWNAYTAWADTASCTESTPSCSNGALERRCQQRTRYAIEG